MKPTTDTWSTASHDPNPGSWSPPELSRAPMSQNELRKIPTRRLRFITFRSSSWYMRHRDGLLIHRSTKPEIKGLNQAYTCPHAPPKFLASPPRAGDIVRSCQRQKTTADVIWRHQMMSSLHVSNHASTSTSALVHVIDTSSATSVVSSRQHHVT